MAAIRVSDYVRADLISSMGVFPLSQVQITETVNQGCSWSCSIADYKNPKSPNIADVTEDIDFCIRIRTLADDYTSPPLRCENPGRTNSTSGRSGRLSGLDKATWLMSKDDLTLDTFINMDTTSIIQRCVQTETGISVLGLERMPIPEDDVKNSKILDVLNRYLAFTAQNWVLTRDGKVKCFPITYAGPINTSFRYTTISDDKNFSSRVDSLKIEKTSKISSGEEVCFTFDSIGFKTVQLPQPLFQCLPIDRSSYGYIELVTTFSGDAQGVVTGKFPFRDDVIILSGPMDITLPTTYASLVVREPKTIIGTTPISAKVCFAGTPLNLNQPNEPIQLSAGFRRLIGNPSGSRPARDIWTDTLMPSPQWLEDHALGYLIERNKDYWPMSASGPINLTASLLQRFTSPDFPVATLQSFSHSINVSSNSAQTTYSGYVPYPTVAPEIGYF